MPGRHLNDIERELRDWWQRENFQSPVLKRVEVAGRPGLRGMTDLAVDFGYPLSVVCGRNGTGKSTVLAIAALAFGGSAGHVPPNALRRPSPGEDFSYYTFRDFFHRGPSDPDIAGVEISWTYSGPLLRRDGREASSPIRIAKQTSKWMHYERRPSKPTYYLGVSRSIPAVEQRALRSRFTHRGRHVPLQLEAGYRARLADIMGRPYAGAQTLSDARYDVRTATASATYSSFNMGAGEDVLIELFTVLQEAPVGSLIVLEEVEQGLHPEAVRRLARHLQEVMLAKRLQVVASTHSEHFLDAVPRIARVLIQRQGDVHEAIVGPTARFAAGHMSGRPDPELRIYCEDGFAERLVGASLDAGLRQRTAIRPVGAKSGLVPLARLHQAGGLGELVFLLWDGDVTDIEIRGWFKTAVGQGLDPQSVSWSRLPVASAPESWVVDELDCPEGYQLLADELGETPAMGQQLIQELLAVPDPHNISHRLAERQQLRSDEAEQRLINAFRKLNTDPLQTVRAAVERVLDSHAVQEPQLEPN